MMLRVMLAFLCLWAGAAQAQDSAFLYSKSQLAIIRKSLQQDPNMLPWQKQQAEELARIVFNVEVRDGRSLYNQKGWFSLSGYEERSGVLLAFSSPTLSPIVRSQQYAPVDILMIDRQGKVTQILPNIMLSDLEEGILPQSPILAFLFLKSGTCEQLVIAPGDMVEFSIFKKPPTVLGNPVATEGQSEQPVAEEELLVVPPQRFIIPSKQPSPQLPFKRSYHDKPTAKGALKPADRNVPQEDMLENLYVPPKKGSSR